MRCICAVQVPCIRNPFTLDALRLRGVDGECACARASGWQGLSASSPLVYSSSMRGKSGHWGNPFTKGNANAMRLRGLDIRRSSSGKRLARALRGGESTEPVSQTQVARPSQPSRQPRPDAAKLSPAVEAEPAHTHAASVPGGAAVSVPATKQGCAQRRGVPYGPGEYPSPFILRTPPNSGTPAHLVWGEGGTRVWTPGVAAPPTTAAASALPSVLIGPMPIEAALALVNAGQPVPPEVALALIRAGYGRR